MQLATSSAPRRVFVVDDGERFLVETFASGEAMLERDPPTGPKEGTPILEKPLVAAQLVAAINAQLDNAS